MKKREKRERGKKKQSIIRKKIIIKKGEGEKGKIERKN